ncbi:MAG: BolA/IbaG family iron-sulfur metabolism protein [Acidobacteriota bacterium]|nr:BolA/IbaG family iron-sulfur metabolism protein [Acidobacteriota bacterium]
MLSTEDVRRLIEEALPGARVEVGTFQGDDHFAATVEAPQFVGKTRVEQHQMVYRAVRNHLGGAMHALQLTTRPLESEPTNKGAGS